MAAKADLVSFETLLVAIFFDQRDAVGEGSGRKMMKRA